MLIKPTEYEKQPYRQKIQTPLPVSIEAEEVRSESETLMLMQKTDEIKRLRALLEEMKIASEEIFKKMDLKKHYSLSGGALSSNLVAAEGVLSGEFDADLLKRKFKMFILSASEQLSVYANLFSPVEENKGIVNLIRKVQEDVNVIFPREIKANLQPVNLRIKVPLEKRGAWKNKDSMKAHGELCRLILNTNNSGAQIKAQMAALAVIARFYISIDPRVGKFGNNGSNTDVISSADNKVLEAAGVSISEHGGFVCRSNDDFNGQLQCLEKMAMHENHKSADGKGTLLGCTRSIQSFYNEVLLPFDQDHKPVKGNFMAWGTAPKAQKNVIEKLNKIADTPKLYSDVKYRV